MFNLNLKFDSVQKHNDIIHENGIYNEILSKQYEIQNAVINTIDIMVLKFENKYTCKYINDFVQNEICWGNRGWFFFYLKTSIPVFKKL